MKRSILSAIMLLGLTTIKAQRVTDTMLNVTVTDTSIGITYTPSDSVNAILVGSNVLYFANTNKYGLMYQVAFVRKGKRKPVLVKQYNIEVATKPTNADVKKYFETLNY